MSTVIDTVLGDRLDISNYPEGSRLEKLKLEEHAYGIFIAKGLQTVWNNIGGESYKPWDISVWINGVEWFVDCKGSSKHWARIMIDKDKMEDPVTSARWRKTFIYFLNNNTVLTYQEAWDIRQETDKYIVDNTSIVHPNRSVNEWIEDELNDDGW